MGGEVSSLFMGGLFFFWVKICRDFAYIIISQTMHLQDEGLWNKEGRIFLLPAYSFFFFLLLPPICLHLYNAMSAFRDMG